MAGKESLIEKLERMQKEHEIKQRPEEWVKTNLRWEDWGTLLPELVGFAQQEIRRRRWRGGRLGVLPQGYDGNSVAAEVITAALRGEARLVLGWTRERLMRELKRMVSNEVRRLHKLQETRKMRSEWEVLPPGANGQRRSVLDGMTATGLSGMDGREWRARDEVRKETEIRIAEELRAESETVEKLFSCLREGVVKRREIAAKLGISVAAVTNCRRRLDRKLDELGKEAGCPQWVIEEWKAK